MTKSSWFPWNPPQWVLNLPPPHDTYWSEDKALSHFRVILIQVGNTSAMLWSLGDFKFLHTMIFPPDSDIGSWDKTWVAHIVLFSHLSVPSAPFLFLRGNYLLGDRCEAPHHKVTYTCGFYSIATKQWPMDQLHQHHLRERNVESQVPILGAYWLRIFIKQDL